MSLKSDDQNNFSLSLEGTQKNPFGERTASKLSFRLQSLNSNSDLLMAVPEAYIQFGSQVTFGRLKTAYSETDRALEMGCD